MRKIDSVLAFSAAMFALAAMLLAQDLTVKLLLFPVIAIIGTSKKEKKGRV